LSAQGRSEDLGELALAEISMQANPEEPLSSRPSATSLRSRRSTSVEDGTKKGLKAADANAADS
jgi:hypothetical protein